MNDITIYNVSKSIPSKWSEIDYRTLMWLSKRFPYSPTYGFSFSYFIHSLDLPKNIRLSLALAKGFIQSKRLDKRWKDDALVEFGESNFFQQQIIQAMAAMDNFSWLHEIGIMDKCLIKSFRLGWVRYYGPGELLANVISDEFKDAEEFLTLFLSTKDLKYLDYMIAVLWREKAEKVTQDDIRVPYSDFSVQRRVQKIHHLPQHLKNACLINYIGLRNYFVNRESSRIVFSRSSSSSSETQNWGTILLRISENHTFGIHNQVKRTYIHDIVDYLADQIKRDKK